MRRFNNLKKNEIIRDLVADVHLDRRSFIQPYFVVDGNGIKEEIASMPGQYRFSVDKFFSEVDELLSKGVRSLLLFGVPENKDWCGSSGFDGEGIIQKAVKGVKSRFGNEIYVVTDLCMCEYTDHGHCGIIKDGVIDNDETLKYLSKIALSHAAAGADMVAPSDMMDGRVGYLRKTLDDNGFITIPIMSYSVKYASAYYGPFRCAAGSAPQFGDRRSYQMDYRRSGEGMDKVLADLDEGADIVMVKPALAYLDVLREIKGKVNCPLAVYNVSGEYAMVKFAAAAGAVDEKRIVMENFYAFKRAGADIIISYHCKDAAEWIGGSK